MEIFPLVVACKMTGGLEVLLMDGVKTKNVILALLQLESRYNSISSISCGGGTNLLNISETDKWTTAEVKVLKKLESVKQNLPNSQRRNFIE